MRKELATTDDPCRKFILRNLMRKRYKELQEKKMRKERQNEKRKQEFIEAIENDDVMEVEEGMYNNNEMDRMMTDIDLNKGIIKPRKEFITPYADDAGDTYAKFHK